MSFIGLDLPRDMPFSKQIKLCAIYGCCWGFGMGFGIALLVLIAAAILGPRMPKL